MYELHQKNKKSVSSQEEWICAGVAEINIKSLSEIEGATPILAMIMQLRFQQEIFYLSHSLES